MAKQQKNKTNAMRLLDAAKIKYEVIEYEVDESDLSGTHIADTIGLEALSPELEKTAKARLKYSDYPLSDLADILVVSKSCLNHRLRKLVAIADSIK